MVSQVLHDLPPKIVQDIYCDMSPLQRALYEDFQNSQVGVLGVCLLCVWSGCIVHDWGPPVTRLLNMRMPSTACVCGWYTGVGTLNHLSVWP